MGGHTLDQPTLIRLREDEDRARERAEVSRELLEETPPVLARFNQEAMGAAIEIRDFKRTATNLLLNCQTLSVINPLLADHVTREAEKFLEILDRLQQRLGPVRGDALVVEEPAPPCVTAEATPRMT